MLSVKLQNLNKYYQIQSYIITFFFCILPISLIAGNLATNINILLKVHLLHANPTLSIKAYLFHYDSEFQIYNH